jgi:hypothetical protein
MATLRMLPMAEISLIRSVLFIYMPFTNKMKAESRLAPTKLAIIPSQTI